jgi:hypothetical protein
MVYDHVQYYFYAPGFAQVNESSERADVHRVRQSGSIEQASVDLCKVLWPAVVVRFRGAVALNVLVNGRYPYCRHAKLEEIVELFDNAVERSTVDARVRCIGILFIPAEETIRYYEVNDIILRNLFVRRLKIHLSEI